MRRSYEDLRDLYTPLEYIQANGTQYIDTGFAPNNNTRLVLDFKQESFRDWSDMVGTFGGANGTNRFFFFNCKQNNLYYSYYGTNHGGTPAYQYNTRRLLDMNKGVLKLDSYTYTRTSSAFQSVYNIILFGVTNYSGIVAISKVILSAYSLKIYDNGLLIRDYVPKLRIADGKPGLYDLCGSICPHTNTPFYVNAGTGEFLYQ